MKLATLKQGRRDGLVGQPDPEPDSYDTPEDTVPSIADAYDAEEGYPVDVEDIAIVAWEAVRALKTTQGAPTGPSWMHVRKAHKDDFIVLVQASLDDPQATIADDPQNRLIHAIARALKA